MKGKNVLIVGSSKGIGSKIVSRCLKEGAIVHAVSRSAQNFQESSGVYHQTIDVLHDDLSQLQVPESLSGLVYCPGSITLKSFSSLQEEDFLEDFRINCLGTARVIQRCLSSLKRSERSSVILFSSVAAQVGLAYHASIATAKGGVEALAKSLAAELAGSGIRVNCLALSITDTPLASALLSTEKRAQQAAQRHPLQRVGNAEEVAAMACLLLSDLSGWVTGQVYAIDGGLSTLKTL